MGREHLAVGVDVYTFALGLFQDVFEVLQIVPGDQDRLALPGPEGNGCRDRMAVTAGIGCIEQLHRQEVDFTALQDEAEHIFKFQAAVINRGQAFLYEVVNRFVLPAQDACVVRICGKRP